MAACWGAGSASPSRRATPHPLDYQDPGAATVARRVAAGLHPGAIVSLHTGHAGTVAAFGPMVASAREQGFRAVTVSDLLSQTAHW